LTRENDFFMQKNFFENNFFSVKNTSLDILTVIFAPKMAQNGSKWLKHGQNNSKTILECFYVCYATFIPTILSLVLPLSPSRTQNSSFWLLAAILARNGDFGQSQRRKY
jgi:hypothetical protein